MKTIRSNLSFMYRVALFVSYQFATGCKKQIKHNWHSNTPVMSVKSMGWLTTDFVLPVLKNTILWNHFIALQSRQKATNQYYWFYWSHRVNNNFITTQRFLCNGVQDCTANVTMHCGHLMNANSSCWAELF